MPIDWEAPPEKENSKDLPTRLSGPSGRATPIPLARVSASLGNRGKGYLKAKARALNCTARSIPVFVLIDLDHRNPCPADVLMSWFHGVPEANMLFRVAVMEIESWVLADRDNCSGFLGIPMHRIPQDTDAIDNPKEFVVNLARRSKRREIRDELVPTPGSIVPVGPAYNAQLCAFVLRQWDPCQCVSYI